eukprot:TRINITY_DN1666_c0_g1_i1.p1 TRINITY_DN1666_c0_g1~~TRINITY_DN1666_c0_g1_i1.p1  ORF type:complete len:175 (+),score=45.89 TRINITY_DN1666_c0_g1_i1:224-748(+)
MPGCGNSTLSEEMYKDGFLHITNIDFSEIVIETMKERCKDMPEMKWEVMDIFSLGYADKSFDVVLDKGTLDAIMSERGDKWEVDEELDKQITQICCEYSRVLKEGGVFVYVTFGQPHFRKPLLNKEIYNWGWEIENNRPNVPLLCVCNEKKVTKIRTSQPSPPPSPHHNQHTNW